MNTPHGPDPRRPKPHSASAVFHQTADVKTALEHLVRAGVPRDLIDVVVTPEAADQFYPGGARAPGNEALRFAGAGALLGLVAGAIVSLILIFIPGFMDSGILPIIQLIGPNFATVAGALIGGVIGLFTPRKPNPRHARAAEVPNAVVVVVTLRSREEAEHIAQILSASGGDAPRIER